MNRIIGYTTIDQTKTSKTLTDLELAKRDLMNHFHIRKGEKWTDPNFGSNLPYYVFQPLDDETVELIAEDVYSVVSYDPRFEIAERNVTVETDDHYVMVNVKLIYVPTTTATDLQIKFDLEFAETTEF